LFKISISICDKKTGPTIIFEDKMGYYEKIENYSKTIRETIGMGNLVWIDRYLKSLLINVI
jgi:hypothetical protein